MKITRGFAFACLALVVLAAFSGQAFAAHYAQVGSCTPPNAPLHTYTTIQAAVTASTAGTIIEICPGNYPEQVAIGKNLTLVGVGNTSQDAAVILPPAGGMVQNATDVSNSDPIAAQIFVQYATVSISNLTVDGLVNLSAFTVRALSFPVRFLQTGILQSYALAFVLGLLAIFGYYWVR